MKYILRTLWVIGFIPVILLGMASTLVYLMIGFPIAAAIILIKTGNVKDDDILMPSAIAKWLLDKYCGLLDKIK